jgi:hypothetical protein
MKQLRKQPILQILKGLFDHGLENTGLFYSTYRGVVADVDDPEHLQRLRLIIPQVSGNQSYDYWAFPKGVFYGECYGSQVLPQKGDMVWVEFEGGKPEIPIWSHGHPARKEMPDDPELKDPNCFWFYTPGGNKVKINDTKNTIHIENRFGEFVEINEQAISIVTTKKISLGTLNGSTYRAVLGEPTEDLLKDINAIIKDLHTAMLQDLAKFTALGFVKTAAVLPTLTIKVGALAAKLDLILSNINTLDK